MNRKNTLILVVMLLAVFFALTFVACDVVIDRFQPNADDTPAVDFSTVYAMAEEAGYTGTMDELIAAFKGDSAYDIAKASGYSGTQEEWLVSLIGAAGQDGVTPTIGENDHWFIGEVDTGITAKGQDGKDGVGVESVEKTGTEGLHAFFQVPPDTLTFYLWSRY